MTTAPQDYGTLTLADAGEASVIAAIRQAAPSSANGDDAAVLTASGPHTRTVCTTDMLVEGRHFRLDYSTGRDVGAKAVTQNFADIQAMGARPTALLAAIAAPGDTPVQLLADIAAGIHGAASPWGAELVGGDVVTGREIVISLTALGELAGPAPALCLDGAAPGHVVIAEGKIGASAAGLAILDHFGSREEVPEDPVLQSLVAWHCAPQLTVGRGSIARATGVRSMTDNSDGFLRDLEHLARSSGVMMSIDSAAIAPDDDLLHAAAVTGHDAWEWVLTGGEDHTLLGTTDRRIPTGYRAIGTVTSRRRAADTADTVDCVRIDGMTPRYRGGWESL